MHRALFAALVCAVLALTTTGCATIIKGTTEDIRVNSEPQGAHVTFTDMEGDIAYEGTTPKTFVVEKSAKKYDVSIKLDGYQEAHVRIHNEFEAWTICNVVCGGLVGFAVDVIDGAMWKLRPEHIAVVLQHAAPAAPPNVIIPGGSPPPVAPPQGVPIGPTTDAQPAGDQLYVVFYAKDSQGQLRSLAIPLIKEREVLASR